MINGRITIEKVRGFIKFLVIIVCCVSPIYADSTNKKIIKLFWGVQALNKKIINNLVFELAENQYKYRGESTEKYLLKDSEGSFWLFKTYIEPTHVKKDIIAYQLAQLFGLTLPLICDIRLPINGEIIYGSIQKIMFNVTPLKMNLLPCQIEDIQKHHILDWLISNYDVAKDEFLINKKTNEIIAIDKDDAFSEEKTFSPGDNPWGNSYYSKFCNNYMKGQMDVDFTRVFELIDYIQSIENRLLKKIIKNSLDNVMPELDINETIHSVISKKKNLRKDFMLFYHKTAQKTGGKIYIPSRKKTNDYSKIILKNFKKSVFQKKQHLIYLMNKKGGKQKNIEVVSSKRSWYMIDRLGYPPKDKFVSLGIKNIDDLKKLRKEVSSFSEKLAISLYVEKINEVLREKGWQNIGESKLKRITENPKCMDVSQIESTLRLFYGEIRKTTSEYKNEMEKHPNNVLAHLNYIQSPLDDTDKKERKEEYKRKLNREPDNSIYQLAYGILTDDSEYLKKIDDKFLWKYLALDCLENGKQGYKKVIALNNDQDVVCWAHILLGNFFEYNHSKKCRFGEGFNIEAAINEFNKASQIKPDLIESHMNLGILYLIIGKTEEALNAFKEINKLNSQYGAEHFHFDKIKEKRFCKGEREYLESVKMNTLSGEHHYVMGLFYAVKKDYKNAKKHFNKAREFGYKCEKDLISTEQ